METITFTNERKRMIGMKALMAGIPVAIGSYKYRIFKRGETITLPFEKIAVLENADYWVGVDVTNNAEYYGADELKLIDFIRAMDNANDEDIVGYAFSLGMKPEHGLRT